MDFTSFSADIVFICVLTSFLQTAITKIVVVLDSYHYQNSYESQWTTNSATTCRQVSTRHFCVVHDCVLHHHHQQQQLVRSGRHHYNDASTCDYHKHQYPGRRTWWGSRHRSRALGMFFFKKKLLLILLIIFYYRTMTTTNADSQQATYLSHHACVNTRRGVFLFHFLFYC